LQLHRIFKLITCHHCNENIEVVRVLSESDGRTTGPESKTIALLLTHPLIYDQSSSIHNSLGDVLRMRGFYSVVIGLGLTLSVGALQGCGDGGASSSEVHRTAEFQKAALNSRDAMLEHMKTQEPAAKKGRRGGR
jgi:thiamine biosynthesis protein ThiC